LILTRHGRTRRHLGVAVAQHSLSNDTHAIHIKVCCAIMRCIKQARERERVIDRYTDSNLVPNRTLRSLIRSKHPNLPSVESTSSSTTTTNSNNFATLFQATRANPDPTSIVACERVITFENLRLGWHQPQGFLKGNKPTARAYCALASLTGCPLLFGGVKTLFFEETPTMHLLQLGTCMTTKRPNH
jgi:ribosomal protein L28